MEVVLEVRPRALRYADGCGRKCLAWLTPGQRLDLLPAGPHRRVQRPQLGLPALIYKARRCQVIGSGEVEQDWRRRSHRQSYR